MRCNLTIVVFFALLFLLHSSLGGLPTIKTLPLPR